MAFGGFVCTNFGLSLDAKMKAGKSIIMTRVALGDGSIGTSSVYDVTKLKSERFSLPVSSVSYSSSEAIVTALLSNDMLEAGFPLREMGLMAVDPDTKDEGVYLYNRDNGEGEYLPDKYSSQTLKEYLRIRCKSGNAANITFEANSNPVDVSKEDLEEFERRLYAATLTVRTLQLCIPVSAWQQETGRGYVCDVEVALLLERDHVDIGFAVDSLEVAMLCNLDPSCEVLDGRLRFHAEQIPDTDLNGECVILARRGDYTPRGDTHTVDDSDIDALFESLPDEQNT